MTQRLMMMAKEPQPKRCKTRLCPPLQPDEATDLYRGFLADLLQKMRHLAQVGYAPGVAYTPESDVAYFERCAPDMLRIEQQGADLGERLCTLAGRCLDQGDASVVIMSSDSPTLPMRLLRMAFRHLQRTDLVLGPCEDGGYYLVGMRRHIPEIFRDITWSSDQVMIQTLARARTAGVEPVLLPRWYDVDTPQDLDRLAAALCEAPTRHGCPATQAVIQRLVEARRLLSGRLFV